MSSTGQQRHILVQSHLSDKPRTMKNLSCRKLSIRRWNADSKICNGCAKLADVNGKSVIFFASLKHIADQIELWLEYRLVDAHDLASGSFLPWEKCNVSSVLGSRSNDLVCASLDIINGGESIVIAMRSGEIVAVQSDSGDAVLVGEFLDDSPERNGVLGVKTSPDGTVIAIASPVNVTIMSSDWDVLAEVPLQVVGVSASISWRGDGEFFVVSEKSQSGIVSGYVLSRVGQLVSELDVSTLPNREGKLGDLVAWQPRVGGLICHSGPGCRLSFFERNGLRHLRSDFDLCTKTESVTDVDETSKLLLLEWSFDSDKLAAASQDSNCFYVDIFTRANYKWYKKKRLRCNEKPVALLWDEDDTNALFIVTASHDIIALQLQPVSGHVQTVSATHAAVVDGRTLMITNLSQAIIPPPMCHGTLEFSDCVDAVCCLPVDPGFGVLLCDGTFLKEVFSSDLRHIPNIPAVLTNGLSLRECWALNAKSVSSCGVCRDRFPTMLTDDVLITVRCQVIEDVKDTRGSGMDEVCVFRLLHNESNARQIGGFVTSGTVLAASTVASDPFGILIATDDGTLLYLEVRLNSGSAALSVKQQYSHRVLSETVAIESLDFTDGTSTFALIHCKIGHLIAVDLETAAMFVVSKECTSYAVYEKFLTFTTRNHVLYCLPLERNKTLPKSGDMPESKSLFRYLTESCTEGIEINTSWEKLPMLPEICGATRPIDRGSVIVSALKNDVRLILQAPRGNLETVSPRPIVQERVRNLGLRGEYGEAFRLSRQQRVDMNIMVDVDTDAFLSNVQQFVVQVGNPSHISVFLTYLKGSVQRTNAICEAVICALKGLMSDGSLGSADFIPALLTAYIRKSPADYESALLEIWARHKNNDERTTAHLDYLFMLCKDDAALYGHALGIYDLSLAVLVAKTSKELDPAEYTKELRQLQRLGEHERKYSIDVKLGRYDSALRHLYRHETEEYAKFCDNTTFEGVFVADSRNNYQRSVSLAIERAVFPTALELFHTHKEVSRLLRSAYGAHLMTLERYEEAAVVYCSNEELESAARAYDRAGNWELAVGAMARSGLDEPTQRAFYSAVADSLQERVMAREAAHVRITLLGDVEGGLEILLGAELWMVAIDAVASAPNASLWAMVGEAVREAGTGLAADVKENAVKVRERGKRLVVVRETKRLFRERMRAPGSADLNEDGSDAFSSSTASSIGSNVSDLTFVGRRAATSVYTTATGSVSAAERRKEKSAQRRKNKEKKKRVKEGHPQEEEFLVQHLRKMIPGEFLNTRVKNMVDALLFFREIQIAGRVADAMTELAKEALNLSDDVIANPEIREVATRRDWVSDIFETLRKNSV